MLSGENESLDAMIFIKAVQAVTEHEAQRSRLRSTFAMAQTNGSDSVYQLYYNPFSICSLFVLYTLELKGKPRSPSDSVDPERCFVDIYTNEQMSEAYLEKNPKGQVRFIVSNSTRCVPAATRHYLLQRCTLNAYPSSTHGHHS